MKTDTKGFTLIELMISAAILSFIIAGMTIALQQQQRQFNISRETIDIDQTGRAVLDFISSEIRNAGAMQGKTFSLNFLNGGSNFIGNNNNCNNNTDNPGTVDSPPDCLEIFTWDITRGLNFSTSPVVETTMPSVFTRPQIVSIGDGLVVNFPEEWIDDTTGNLIGEDEQNEQILLGVRTRGKLCDPDPTSLTAVCINNPERCSECSLIFRATVNEGLREITINEILRENLPVNFDSVSEFVSGKNSADGTNFNASDLFGSSAEMTIVESKIFRVNTETRELLMNTNHATNNGSFVFQPIAGGPSDPSDENDSSLSSPGVADLQFVFNLRNADGTITKVGYCDGETCNNEAREIWSDFSEIEANQNLFGRENSIQSVEIYLVMKSKLKPRRLQGGMYEQVIPEIADVEERTVDDQSEFIEPEEGFLYRVFSTTVFTRNLAREEIF